MKLGSYMIAEAQDPEELHNSSARIAGRLVQILHYTLHNLMYYTKYEKESLPYIHIVLKHTHSS